MLSELELARMVGRCGSAMKCGTVKTTDPMPITTEPGKTKKIFTPSRQEIKLKYFDLYLALLTDKTLQT